jgi:hypothetical protein
LRPALACTRTETLALATVRIIAPAAKLLVVDQPGSALLVRRWRRLYRPRVLVMLLAPCLAHGRPRFPDPTLVGIRGIGPIRLLGVRKLALSDLDQRLVGVHTAIHDGSDTCTGCHGVTRRSLPAMSLYA